MALRDHSLDEKIRKAAFSEFMKFGYSEASLRKIADVAGVTIGAIRTRFKTKDELFYDCIAPLVSSVKEAFETVKAVYTEEAEALDKDGLKERLKTSMLYESKTVLDILFAHYEEAVLLLNKSGGSPFENFFDRLIDRKTAESIAFLNGTGDLHVDEGLLRLFISLQFHSYSEIVERGFDKGTAEGYMKALIEYHYGGWCAFFDLNNNSDGGRKNEI